MQSDQTLVSIVLPAFNEAALFECNLDELLHYLPTLSRTYRFEVIVVDDGSTDGTAGLADLAAAERPQVLVSHHRTNRGLGAALRTGFARARGDIIVTLDLDLSYAPHYVADLLRSLREQSGAIAIASPYIKGGLVRNVPWMRKEMSAWANRFLSIATGGRIATLTGMVRAYDARALRALRVDADGMDINHELVFAALKKGMRVIEIPAQLEWRCHPRRADNPRAGTSVRRSNMRTAAHMWSVLASGFRHRPSMLFVMPGLIPGLLPVVVAVLLLFRPSHALLVIVTLATMIIQGLSLAGLAVLTGSYIRQLRLLSRRAPLHDSGTRSRA